MAVCKARRAVTVAALEQVEWEEVMLVLPVRLVGALLEEQVAAPLVILPKQALAEVLLHMLVMVVTVP
jgi:hypothetical protein